MQKHLNLLLGKEIHLRFPNVLTSFGRLGYDGDIYYVRGDRGILVYFPLSAVVLVDDDIVVVNKVGRG